MAVSRRALIRGGFTVTAVGALGATIPITAGAAGEQQSKAAARPTIHGCDEWGARPPNGTISVLDRTPTYIVVHHTAGGNSSDLSLAHAFAISRGIQDFHMDGRGWIDSGQQLTNSRGGHVTEGRHRSVEILDGGTRHVLGAHVGDHNSETIGIENEGLYSTVDVTPQLWDSLVNLVAYIALAVRHRAVGDQGTPRLQRHRVPRRGPLWTVAGAARRGRRGSSVSRCASTQSWPLLKPGARARKSLRRNTCCALAG